MLSRTIARQSLPYICLSCLFKPLCAPQQTRSKSSKAKDASKAKSQPSRKDDDPNVNRTESVVDEKTTTTGPSALTIKPHRKKSKANSKNSHAQKQKLIDSIKAALEDHRKSLSRGPAFDPTRRLSKKRARTSSLQEEPSAKDDKQSDTRTEHGPKLKKVAKDDVKIRKHLSEDKMKPGPVTRKYRMEGLRRRLITLDNKSQTNTDEGALTPEVEEHPISKARGHPIPEVEGHMSLKEAMKRAEVPKSRYDKLAGEGIVQLSARTQDMTALDVHQPPVPALAYGLDRVLFNPGVYHLQDPRSRVYNFDPYLQKIMPVAEFDFNALKQYITSSKDEVLSRIARENNKKYVGSTSSMTGALGQFHFLLSHWRELNTDMLSRGFPEKAKTFTAINRCPTAIFLRWKNGTYAIDADKQFDTANILSMLGKSMEKLLTLPKHDFERYRTSSPERVSKEESEEPESYHYSTLGDFLMRSQLDAYDPRLPGTGMYDLKTRAVVSIRMDASEYEYGTGYQIRQRLGKWESFEREYYDMLRSTMLKYSLQVRMGRMDGIFVAYHNVERIFGFQYISLPEMDNALHGQSDLTLGDQEFKLSLELLNKILNNVTEKFPQQSVRIHFETREAKVPFMYIFAEPVTEEEAEAIQNTNRDKVEEFERSILGLTKSQASDGPVEDEITEDWEDIKAMVEEEMERDQLAEADEESDANFGEQFPKIQSFAEQLIKKTQELRETIDQHKMEDFASSKPSDPLSDLEQEFSRLMVIAEQLTEMAEELEDRFEEEENRRLGGFIDRLSEIIERHKDDTARLQAKALDRQIGDDEQAQHALASSADDLDEEDDDEDREEQDSEDDAESEDEEDEETDVEKNELAGTEDESKDVQHDPEVASTTEEISTDLDRIASPNHVVGEDLIVTKRSAALSTVSPADTSNIAPSDTTKGNGTSAQEFDSHTEHEFQGPTKEKPAISSSQRPLLAMNLAIRNKVDGRYVERPRNLSRDQDWTVEYSLQDIKDERKAWSLYSACQRRRSQKLEPDENATLNHFQIQLREMSQAGRSWRQEQDIIDKEKGQVVYQPLEGPRAPVAAAK